MELLTVVAIVGVLATIAIILVQRHFRASKSLEAVTIIQAIRSAQEASRAETGSYLNVSTSNGWYPATPDGKTKTSWLVPAGGHADGANWRRLGVSRTDGTQFGFRTYAGAPGPIAFRFAASPSLALQDATDHWYTIEAAGDLDTSNSALSLYGASSWSNELYTVNEGF